MTKARIAELARLRAQVQQAERATGLDQLNPTERDIIYAVADLSQGHGPVRTGSMLEHPLVASVSRPTFFRALTSLTRKAYLAQLQRGCYALGGQLKGAL